jgi:SWI/SNF-related matrix-associated actin-dependent regulator of chromatin subfamily D
MFFLGFSHSPVDFINGLVASQSRDLRTMAAGDAQDFEYERRSDFYKKPWVEDAVMRYMHRQHAAGQS